MVLQEDRIWNWRLRPENRATRSLSGGTHQPNRRVANRRKRTCALEACTKGRETMRHLKPGQTDPSELPAGSKGGTDKESGKEGSWNVGTGVAVNIARAGVRKWEPIRKVVA